MTAPVTYTREELAGAVSDCAVELREKAEAYAHYPRYHRRYTNEANMLDAAATALRQAAAEGQGCPFCRIAALEARWEALKAKASNARMVATTEWGNQTLVAMADLESPPEGV